MEMQASISLRKNRAFIGKTVPVLIDEMIRESLWDGRTEYDAPEIDNGVLVEGEGELKGEIVPVEITNATEYDLQGRSVQERSGA
jgi:ribosomal protein S12 methylthiotransferase